jgi:hypothetical protein
VANAVAKTLSARLRGERVASECEPGEVGVEGKCDRAAEKHLTLPITLASDGSSLRCARRGEYFSANSTDVKYAP